MLTCGQQQPPEGTAATAQVENPQANLVTHLSQDRRFFHHMVRARCTVAAVGGVPVMNAGCAVERFGLLMGHKTSVSARGVQPRGQKIGLLSTGPNLADVTTNLSRSAGRTGQSTELSRTGSPGP